MVGGIVMFTSKLSRVRNVKKNGLKNTLGKKPVFLREMLCF